MIDANLNFLATLESIIDDRVREADAKSYTASLIAAGTQRIAQKLGEEGVELALAAVAGNRADVLDESADLVYHLLVLLRDREIALTEVVATLEARHTA